MDKLKNKRLLMFISRLDSLFKHLSFTGTLV